MSYLTWRLETKLEFSERKICVLNCCSISLTPALLSGRIVFLNDHRNTSMSLIYSKGSYKSCFRVCGKEQLHQIHGFTDRVFVLPTHPFSGWRQESSKGYIVRVTTVKY